MDRRQLVLEFTFISQLSEITSALNSLKKFLWDNNRKLHNELKEELKQINEHKRTITHYVMSSNELNVERGVSIIAELGVLTEKVLTAFNRRFMEGRRELTEKIDMLEELKDKIDSIRVAIELVDHPKSFFA
jgi:chromosome segregation ATPase